MRKLRHAISALGLGALILCVPLVAPGAVVAQTGAPPATASAQPFFRTLSALIGGLLGLPLPPPPNRDDRGPDLDPDGKPRQTRERCNGDRGPDLDPDG